MPPDFETYRKYSRALMEILSGYTSLLQQVSIDEAYLDVTERINKTAETEASTDAGKQAFALALAQHIRDRAAIAAFGE